MEIEERFKLMLGFISTQSYITSQEHINFLYSQELTKICGLYEYGLISEKQFSRFRDMIYSEVTCDLPF